MSVLVHRANESYDPDLLAKPAAALSSMEGLQLEAGQFLLFAKGAWMDLQDLRLEHANSIYSIIFNLEPFIWTITQLIIAL